MNVKRQTREGSLSDEQLAQRRLDALYNQYTAFCQPMRKVPDRWTKRTRTLIAILVPAPFFLFGLVAGLVKATTFELTVATLGASFGSYIFISAWLVEVLVRPDKVIQNEQLPSQESVEGLIGALKVLHPQDAQYMAAKHRDTLRRGVRAVTNEEFMDGRGERLAIVWLETIRTLCDTGAVPQVRDVLKRLDGQQKWASVRMEAAECLAALEERAKLESKGEGLLRAAKVPKRNDLLQPAGNQVAEDQEVLLHPTERGEE